MNALARSDLQKAYQAAKLSEERVPGCICIADLAEAVLKLCHVCQALAEENEELRQGILRHATASDLHGRKAHNI